MSELRPFALIRTGDQWMRCSFDRTFLDPQTGIAELAWTTTTEDSEQPAPPIGAGLAFDNECRLYHTVASADGSSDRVERLLWNATDPLGPAADQPAPVDLFTRGDDQRVGEFTSGGVAPALSGPCGVAVDGNDRLFIAERTGDGVLVYDLWDERLIRRIALPGGRPTDLAARGTDVYCVLSAAGTVVRFTAHTQPVAVALPPACTHPSRIAISPAGTIAILDSAASPAARVWISSGSSIAIGNATDVEWESESVLVVARRPGADFARLEIAEGQPPVRIGSLRARGYDGLGIVALPDEDACCGGGSGRRIGFWTANGFRNAVAARLVFERIGRITTFRLDSGEFQTVWGRLFLDACIPEGSEIRVHYIAADEVDDDLPMLRTAPANVGAAFHVFHPELSAPMPPAALAPDAKPLPQLLHRRESGRELPWTQPPADDRFDTYEAPINSAQPGRYLWVTLELRGNTRVSPKVKCLRAEYPSHDYLRRLPKTYSRDPRAAAFLLRYLAMFEGFLSETEARAVDRDLLLDPCSAPDEVLPWLASFVGLVLDERWASAPGACGCSTIDARRRIIKDVACLFRSRGTLPGLKRFIELYVGSPVVIIEHYRMRGVGAVALGEGGAAFSTSVVGVGFRIGGAVGTDDAVPVGGRAEDAFSTHAHRFTVLVTAQLTVEQLDVVSHIIEVHRPAHTIFDLCTAGAGMRVGRGLIVEVSSIVGRTGGFSRFQLGSTAVLGRGAILGRPGEGGSIGNSRLGTNTRVG